MSIVLLSHCMLGASVCVGALPKLNVRLCLGQDAYGSPLTFSGGGSVTLMLALLRAAYAGTDAPLATKMRSKQVSCFS